MLNMNLLDGLFCVLHHFRGAKFMKCLVNDAVYLVFGRIMKCLVNNVFFLGFWMDYEVSCE